MCPQLQVLEKASEGLYYLSETDAPFYIVEMSNNTDPQEAAVKLVGKDKNAPVEIVTLEYFFRNAVAVYPDATSEQQQKAQRFAALQTLLHKHLNDVNVYRIGSVQVEAYILGRLPDGTLAGLRTYLVET